MRLMKDCVLQTFLWSINCHPVSGDTLRGATPGDKREIGGITQNCVAWSLNVETLESLNKHFCLYLHSQWGKYPLKPAWEHKAYIVGWMNIFCLINLLPLIAMIWQRGVMYNISCSDSWFSCNFQLFLPRSTFFPTFQTHSPNNEFILQNWITHISSHCHKHNRVGKVETVGNGDKNRNLLLYDVNSNLVRSGAILRWIVQYSERYLRVCMSQVPYPRNVLEQKNALSLVRDQDITERISDWRAPSWWEADQKMQFLPQYDPCVSLSV